MSDTNENTCFAAWDRYKADRQRLDAWLEKELGTSKPTPEPEPLPEAMAALVEAVERWAQQEAVRLERPLVHEELAAYCRKEGQKTRIYTPGYRAVLAAEADVFDALARVQTAGRQRESV